MRRNFESLLGLAQRAGKLVSGEELVVKEIRRKHARLVLLADDASDNTKKKITDKATTYGIPVCIVAGRYELGHAIGKAQRVTIAVTDEGFAKKLFAILDQ
ncbi:YlxQ family RNA-binding protein [Guptibacillus algicola]|uniref:YlxQ family RNA-binding protein n=1 Tax=Guptibacillus algicola TaxID=225844 RepID=UPI001CD5D254|nr:YlxQ family RNA-binding protein [Alkalihalobacillus algicola]MCA0988081.1 YlxQ family RNA-binding protein [Alkalihalobacillus algicola]